MIRALVLITALLPTMAAAIECPPSSRPPARCDHPPTIALREYPVPMSQFRETCLKVFFGAVDCNWPVVGQGMRIFEAGNPEPLYGAIVYLEGCKALRRHEIGHVNGCGHNAEWPR